MPKLTPEQFREYYKKLPERLKEAYSSVKVANALQEIGKKYKLHVDKLGKLVNETGWVMLGATHPSEYVKNLSKALEVDETRARAIAQDVNEMVFNPIRDDLKQIHQIKSGGIQQKKDSREHRTETTKSQQEKEVPLKTEEKEPAPPIAPPADVREKPMEKQIPRPEQAHKGTLQAMSEREKILKEIEEAGVTAEIPERKAEEVPEKTKPAHARDEKPVDIAQDKSEKKDMAEQKFSKPFALPREQSEHDDTEQERRDEEPQKQETGNTYSQGDPYREPIEEVPEDDPTNKRNSNI